MIEGGENNTTILNNDIATKKHLNHNNTKSTVQTDFRVVLQISAQIYLKLLIFFLSRFASPSISTTPQIILQFIITSHLPQSSPTVAAFSHKWG